MDGRAAELADRLPRQDIDAVATGRVGHDQLGRDPLTGPHGRLPPALAGGPQPEEAPQADRCRGGSHRAIGHAKHREHPVKPADVGIHRGRLDHAAPTGLRDDRRNADLRGRRARRAADRAAGAGTLLNMDGTQTSSGQPDGRSAAAQSAESAVLLTEDSRRMLAVIRALPDRQREAIVLRYYADFSEAETAAAMGISCGAVKSHTARAIAALRADLVQQAAAGPSPGIT